MNELKNDDPISVAEGLLGPVVVIGAGPGGLTAAYELGRVGWRSIVLEKENVVGGLAHTELYKGYRFDIGGHRFFTKVSLVQKIWRDILGDDFIRRPRLSRIYYRSKFFRYPLSPMDAMLKLGLGESFLCGLSYLHAHLMPRRPELTFEDWVSNRFGYRLFRNFFKAYTEKVWGMRCDEIGAAWAAQRIRGLSIGALIRQFLDFRPKDKSRVIKTLIDEFDYPRLGPGMMWERCQKIVESRGSEVLLDHPVTKIYWQPGGITGVEAGGRCFRGTHFISTMPIRELLRSLEPPPPDEVLRAANDFHYRDFILVALILRGPDPFPDNWIYVQEPNVMVGRIQNFKSWSPEMVPGSDTCCLGMEYFCFEGDGLWNRTDQELIDLGKSELGQMGLADPCNVIDGKVVRTPKAYPIYNDTYQRGLKTVRDLLATLPNLQLVGRNGMHSYNNQDHSMLTAVLAARNILGGSYDLWAINADDEYHETGGEITETEIAAFVKSQPLVPASIKKVKRATTADVG